MRFWQLMSFVGLTCLMMACQESTGGGDVVDAAKESGNETTDAVSAPAAVQENTIAQTQHGPVRGFLSEGIATFKGIRYGADSATTRFAPPAMPVAWEEPQDALAFGPSCPQPQRPILSLFDSWVNDPDPGMSEDCLFLNVWTPALDSGKRPVMVWLHGGGFTTGSGSSNAYDGTRLANRGDVVIVSVNHRLNVFGYTHLDAYGEQFAGSGNAGMLDLVAALTWVRDNVGNFGGDPDNVLIFGESGGGWKVTTLMAMDAARGLFHRAVAQSGPALTILEGDIAATQSAALVNKLGLSEENIADLRTMSTEDISQAAAELAAEGVRLGTRPVIDGVHNHRHPFTPNAPEQSAEVPLLIGSTQTEMSMLIGAGQRELFDLTWETLPDALSAAIPGLNAAAVVSAYRELHPEIDPPNLFFEATTDNSVFGRGSFDLADRKAEQGRGPVYQYYFTWRTPVENGMWGATHALDIGFVFDNVARSESMSGLGEEQQALADVMSEAWLAFARSGDPNHDGLPDWPQYETTNRATMIFDSEPRVVNDPRGRERAILDAAL